jgi:SNF2 family DNA or RNA helicase
MDYKPHDYQKVAHKHIVDNPFCGVFMDMGLGKTVVTGTVLNELIWQDLEYEKALVIAPKHVTRSVWKQEMAKWDHLKHLKVSIVWGKNAAERIKALRAKADIYVINRENLVWLVNLFKSKWPFRLVVIDELSSFKNHATQRFKHMKMVRPHITRLIGLTGTPAPNSLMDLWAPVYLMDEGERLHKNITQFREHYFAPEKMDGYVVHSYKIKKGAAEEIYQKIGDICISMKARDYLELPPLVENDIHLNLDEKTFAKYEEFERDSILEIFKDGEDIEVTAMNAAALTNKLLQFANGALYYENESGNRMWTEVHQEKLEALEELMEELYGQTALVAYTYQHDLHRILKRFPYARVLKTDKDILDWNAGKLRMMVLHPASAGHGLNLQHGGNNLISFGHTWSAELYAQLLARLMRQGQEKPVFHHKLIMADTMDMDVIQVVRKKMAGQDALMEAVKARVERVVKRIA